MFQSWFVCGAVARAGCGLVIAMLGALNCASADSLTPLYVFHGPGAGDGAYPLGELLLDTAGNLYGTTISGGAECCGTVFKLAPDGTETILHSFNGTDGDEPVGNLVMDRDGNLYGTTFLGGGVCNGYGCGNVYKIAPDGTETNIYTFQGGRDGLEPGAGLIMHKGDLYGTTGYGGGNGCSGAGCGTVFKITPEGKEKVLYAFTGKDGSLPEELIMDESGDLYGTAETGGSKGFGVAFELTPDGTETTLHDFVGGSDGSDPVAGLISDKAGNLYGTTSQGGTGGIGTAFELSPDGTETVLHSFIGGNDGSWPFSTVFRSSTGDLYGTTYSGGGSRCRYQGCGTVFKLSPDGSETMLHVFSRSRDGHRPEAGLVADKNGYLYGTTTEGGDRAACPRGCGTVFRLKK